MLWIFEKSRNAGFYAMNIPQKFGGGGLSAVAMSHVEQEMGQTSDILVPKITPTFQADRTVIATGLLGEVGAGTTELHVVRVLDADPAYVRYLLSSHLFLHGGEAEMIGVAGQKRVPEDWLLDLRVPISDIPTQQRVARFLDGETRRIEHLVAAKKQLLELLDERRKAVIERATRQRNGLQVRLGFLLAEVDERLGDRTELSEDDLLAVSIHHGVVPRSFLTEDLPRAEEFGAYKMCREGDVVINRLRAFQGGVGTAPQAGIVSPDYLVLRSERDTSTEYLKYLFRSPWFVGEMTKVLRGIGDPGQGNVRTPRVNWKDLRLVEVPDRSVDEQRRIADVVADADRHSLELESTLRRELDLLSERRRSLISAAVTGEMEVP